MEYVSFEYRFTAGGVFYTKAGEYKTAEEAKIAVRAWNYLDSNAKRGYSWSHKNEAPEMKV